MALGAGGPPALDAAHRLPRGARAPCEHLEFLDVLFGDRPALTPVQNFYQRILAGDSEEVLGHAELILQHCSLSSYYEDVVLKALELAPATRRAGCLPPPRRAPCAGRSPNSSRTSPTARTARSRVPGRTRRRRRLRGPGRLQPAAGPSDPEPSAGDLDPRGRRALHLRPGFLDAAAVAILAQILANAGSAPGPCLSPRPPRPISPSSNRRERGSPASSPSPMAGAAASETGSSPACVSACPPSRCSPACGWRMRASAAPASPSTRISSQAPCTRRWEAVLAAAEADPTPAARQDSQPTCGGGRGRGTGPWGRGLDVGPGRPPSSDRRR